MTGVGKGVSWSVVPGVVGIMGLHAALFASGFERLPGDEGDARMLTCLAEHWYQVFQGRADLLSPGMFHPVRGTLGYTEPVPAHAVPFSVLRLAGLDMFSAMAAAVVLIGLLNYVTCFFLLNRALRLTAVASCAGAMFFAFSGPRFTHAGHYNLHASLFLPLAVAPIVHLARRSTGVTEWQAFWLFSAAALGLDLQLLVSPHHGWLFGFWACLALAVAAAVPAARRAVVETVQRYRTALAGSAVVFVVGLVPVGLLYLPAARLLGPRPWGLVHPLVPEGWSLLQMGQGNYVWGSVSAALSRFHPLPSTEHNIGIGLIPSLTWLILTLWAVRVIARGAGPGPARAGSAPIAGMDAWLAVMILATTLVYAIGSKYGDGVSPWRVVYLVVPGASGIRAVARFVLVLGLPMAIVLAVVVQRGLDVIARKPNPAVRRALRAALFAVVAFGVFEQFGRTPSFSKGEQLERLGRLAAALPDGCAAFYVAAAPHRRPIKYEYQVDAMLVSAMRGVPTLNGYSGHEPPGWSLREVEAPDYERRVEAWIARHRVKSPVCRLEVGD